MSTGLLKPLSPLLRWRYWYWPVDVSNFRVLISMLLSSSFVQLIIPIIGLIIGIAKILWNAILFLAYSSDNQIFLTLWKYFLVTFSLFTVPLNPMSSSCPKYLLQSPFSSWFIPHFIKNFSERIVVHDVILRCCSFAIFFF